MLNQNQQVTVESADFFHNDLQKKIEALHAAAEHLPSVIIVHDIGNNLSVIYMSPMGQRILGFSLDDIKALGPSYHATFFNPEDVAEYAPKISELLMSTEDTNKMVAYFQQVRPSSDHDWKWYLTTSKVFHRNYEGKATHIISTASPVDPKHHITNKVNRLLEENNFLRRHQHIFASLSKREKEILKMMALGYSAANIASLLHIAESTAITHRRNIRAKLKAQNSYDIIFFAQSFNLL